MHAFAAGMVIHETDAHYSMYTRLVAMTSGLNNNWTPTSFSLSELVGMYTR